MISQCMYVLLVVQMKECLSILILMVVSLKANGRLKESSLRSSKIDTGKTKQDWIK